MPKDVLGIFYFILILYPKNLLGKNLLGILFARKFIMLFNVLGLPRIANPYILHGSCGKISIILQHIFRECSLLLLVLVLLDENILLVKFFLDVIYRTQRNSRKYSHVKRKQRKPSSLLDHPTFV